MIEEIKFLNRETGSVETEQVYGENWLKLYTDLHLVGFPFGLQLSVPGSRNGMAEKWIYRKVEEKITPFISKYKLDKKEFLKDPSEYNSFNDFFSRKLIAKQGRSTPRLIHLFFQQMVDT